jgi:hypothetical protein
VIEEWNRSKSQIVVQANEIVAKFVALPILLMYLQAGKN